MKTNCKSCKELAEALLVCLAEMEEEIFDDPTTIMYGDWEAYSVAKQAAENYYGYYKPFMVGVGHETTS